MTVKVNPSTNEVVITQNINKVVITSPGPQGPIGPGGAVSYYSTAGETISVYQAVVLIGGLVYVCDVTNLSHIEQFIGVASQSVTAGNIIAVQFGGKLSGGSFTAGSRHFIGLGGLFTTVPEPIGALWTTIIGVAESSSSLILTPYQPVIL